MNKFTKFQEVYDESIETIKGFINDPSPLQKLTVWLMETDANPYSFLQEEYATMMSTAEGFASLLHILHHAIQDDGDVEFLTVDGEPRIIFAHRFDDNFREKVLCRQELEMEKFPHYSEMEPYDIQILDITANEFPEIYNAYHLKRVQEWFASDAGHFGIEFAKEHYKKYSCYSDDWVEECAEEIFKWYKWYNKNIPIVEKNNV